jgi:hypothetical protein
VFGGVSTGRSMDQAGALFIRSTTGTDRVIA